MRTNIADDSQTLLVVPFDEKFIYTDVLRNHLLEIEDNFTGTKNIISQPPLEEKSNIQDDVISKLNMEYKNNLQVTNMNSFNNGGLQEITTKLTPREVFQHNAQVGYNEWRIYKDRVYEKSRVKEVFLFLIEARNKEKTEQKEQRKEAVVNNTFRKHECTGRNDSLLIETRNKKKNELKQDVPVVKDEVRKYECIHSNELPLTEARNKEKTERKEEQKGAVVKNEVKKYESIDCCELYNIEYCEDIDGCGFNEDNCSSDDSFLSLSKLSLDNINLWYAARLLIDCGFSRATIEEITKSSCVGFLVTPIDVKYWDDFRSDIKVLLQDLIRENYQDTLSVHKADYMHLLQRWIKKYRYPVPEVSLRLEGDPNQSRFLLPEDISENPECLRSWIETWRSFDCVVPQNGAWVVIEKENIELGNTHELFLSTLKADIDLSPFDTAINGEAAWNIIPEHCCANDIMTYNQIATERERANRHDLYDLQRMEKRRLSILNYFVCKYKYDYGKVRNFLNWAGEMKKGEQKFITLC